MQRTTSIDDQVAVARRYAHQQAWTVLPEHEYADAGISGTSLEGRPGVQALLRAAAIQPRLFDVLVVDDSSRIARDLPDAVRFLQQLRFFQIRVVYVSQQIDSANEQAETMVAVHGVVDSLYIREMAKKIRRGLVGQLDRGFATGGRTFGYRTAPVPDPTRPPDPDGHPVLLGRRTIIDEAEAETVRGIFVQYATGAGVTKIVESLNSGGNPGPRGEPWRHGTVQRVLRNER
ncbi:MAG: recombinase family protein, partial [Spirochaetes bacterium]|nr:recombinase family protein [Spirochaetota bacterium]